MKAPGLSKAMRAALEFVRDGVTAPEIARQTIDRLYNLGLLTAASMQRHMEDGRRHELTPRGHSALSAPRVTEAELEILEGIERGSTSYQYKHQISALLFNRLRNFDWITISGDDELDIPTVELTKAGTTALNNIRAASGSPEWKP